MTGIHVTSLLNNFCAGNKSSDICLNVKPWLVGQQRHACVLRFENSGKNEISRNCIASVLFNQLQIRICGDVYTFCLVDHPYGFRTTGVTAGVSPFSMLNDCYMRTKLQDKLFSRKHLAVRIHPLCPLTMTRMEPGW